MFSHGTLFETGGESLPDRPSLKKRGFTRIIANQNQSMLEVSFLMRFAIPAAGISIGKHSVFCVQSIDFVIISIIEKLSVVVQNCF